MWFKFNINFTGGLKRNSLDIITLSAYILRLKNYVFLWRYFTFMEIGHIGTRGELI